MQIRKEAKPKQSFSDEQADSLSRALLYLMSIRLERQASTPVTSTPCAQQNS